LTGTVVAAGCGGGVTVIVRLGPLLTVTLVILIVLLSARESGPPRNMQFSPPAVDMDSRSLSRDATGSAPIALTSQSRQHGGVNDAIDLYGNEVNAAVATYELDRAGALYELHSPQTEVPQLPPPKS
jgi:hypothetical protein